MEKELSKLSAFAKYAWFVLVYNLVVIIWGVFLRASHSGDGCGQHWLTCQGEVVPSAPQLKTVIEFSHRLTTGLSAITVLVLFIWAFRRFTKGDPARLAAAFSFVFIIIESLIGAGLVLTGNTADNWTPSRPFWAIGHLINTFLLLAALTLTCWFSSGKERIDFNVDRKVVLLLLVGVLGIFIVGSSGSLAALSNMLFPSTSIIEGFAKDFSGTSPMLVRLRISHPIVSVAVGMFLIFLAGWLKRVSSNDRDVAKWVNILSLLVLVQFASGAATLLLHAPIVMQLVHLFLADAVWISFILLSANFLAVPQPDTPIFEE
ncbi:MAG TPA: COX15/CtaA family protein [Pyrinomonadaceae bacterium]|nr:COX15/CtaA family protein [Pyrinomonadaceae bacterium]